MMPIKLSIQRYSQVTTKCQPMLQEPISIPEKDRVIRENVIRYGDCASKVVYFLEREKILEK